MLQFAAAATAFGCAFATLMYGTYWLIARAIADAFVIGLTNRTSAAASHLTSLLAFLAIAMIFCSIVVLIARREGDTPRHPADRRLGEARYTAPLDSPEI